MSVEINTSISNDLSEIMFCLYISSISSNTYDSFANKTFVPQHNDINLEKN